MRTLTIEGSFKSALELPGMVVNDYQVKKVLVEALSSPSNPQAGIDYNEMQERVDLIRKIKAADGPTIALEKTEHATLVAALKSTRFMVADPAMFDFIKGVAELPETDVATKRRR